MAGVLSAQLACFASIPCSKLCPCVNSYSCITNRSYPRSQSIPVSAACDATMPCHVSQCKLARPHRAGATCTSKQCGIYRVATLETGLKQKQQELNQMHEQLDTLQVKRFDGLHHHSFAQMHLSNPVPAARWAGQEAILPEAKHCYCHACRQ